MKSLFHDVKFFKLPNDVKLVVLYFASISECLIEANQLDDNAQIIAPLVGFDFTGDCNDLGWINRRDYITNQLASVKFKLKISQLEFIPPDFELSYSYVIDNMEKLKDMKSIASIKDDIKNFIGYYESVSWSVGKKKKMTNWKSSLIRWMNREWNKETSKGSHMEESVKAYLLLNEQHKNESN